MNYEKAAELFLEAYHHNWDEGHAKLKRILKDENCDYGTALMIYWLGRPECYLKYAGQTDAPEDFITNGVFLQKLEKDLLSNRYEKYIRYDPKEDMGQEKLENQTIPEVLYQASEGKISGADLISGKIGVNAWFVAAKEGNLEKLKEMLNQGFEINRTDDGGTALVDICTSDRVDNAKKMEIIGFLIQQGIDIHKKSKWGATALSSACRMPGQAIIEIVDYLAQNGANLKQKNKGGNLTFDAAYVRNLELLEYLLAKGVNPLLVSEHRATPLHAVFEGREYRVNPRDSYPIVARLLEVGVDPEQMRAGSLYGRKAIDDAMEWEPTEDIQKSIALLFKHMKGPDTLLMYCADNGHAERHTEYLKLLIEAGANVAEKSKHGWTALFYAAYRGNLDAMELLINAGTDINTQDEEGKTAFMWAVVSHHTKAVELLMKNRADINIRNKDGDTALTLAEKKSYSDIVMLLQKTP